VLESHSEGRDVLPAPGVLLFIKNPLMVRGEQVVPVRGVVNAFAVGGDEGGYHSAFTTAEAGSNNPKGTWPLEAKLNIFPGGDSFAYGDCVRQGEDVASRLRERVPHVVSLSARQRPAAATRQHPRTRSRRPGGQRLLDVLRAQP